MNKNIYDYIVIGAGTAGGIIGKKLSDNRGTSVLLLDPGTNMSLELSSASNAVSEILASNNKYAFNVFTSIEERIINQLKLSSGRVLGGSSEINAMYAVRGSSNLYDRWANLVGSQWSYQNISPLFISNETYTGNSQDSDERGTNGPIFIRQQIIPKDGVTVTFAEAASTVLGIPIVEDYNTGIRDCTFYKSQFFNKEVSGIFVRSSTATGYLNEQTARHRSEFQPDGCGKGWGHLAIITKATVNKILFSRQKGSIIASGVDFIRNGQSQRAFARKGIILSAGKFSSVILQRSGIGRTSDLVKIGLSTLVESPNVGYNFQAHFTAGMGIEVETKRLLNVVASDPDQHLVLGAFKGENGSGGRHLQLYGVAEPSFVPAQEVLLRNWRFDPAKPSNIMSIGIFDINPKSVGTIMVTSTDPEAYPSSNLNPLSNLDDLEYMVDQYIEVYKIILKARELDPEGIYRIVFPPEDIFDLPDENEKRKRLAGYVRASYRNLPNFGGQCRMGRNIQEGVVDGFLNVFGTKNLKVADLSISPVLPDGSSAMAAQMIALNAVRFIQEDQDICIAGLGSEWF